MRHPSLDPSWKSEVQYLMKDIALGAIVDFRKFMSVSDTVYDMIQSLDVPWSVRTKICSELVIYLFLTDRGCTIKWSSNDFEIYASESSVSGNELLSPDAMETLYHVSYMMSIMCYTWEDTVFRTVVDAIKNSDYAGRMLTIRHSFWDLFYSDIFTADDTIARSDRIMFKVSTLDAAYIHWAKHKYFVKYIVSKMRLSEKMYYVNNVSDGSGYTLLCIVVQLAEQGASQTEKIESAIAALKGALIDYMSEKRTKKLDEFDETVGKPIVRRIRQPKSNSKHLPPVGLMMKAPHVFGEELELATQLEDDPAALLLGEKTFKSMLSWFLSVSCIIIGGNKEYVSSKAQADTTELVEKMVKDLKKIK